MATVYKIVGGSLNNYEVQPKDFKLQIWWSDGQGEGENGVRHLYYQMTHVQAPQVGNIGPIPSGELEISDEVHQEFINLLVTEGKLVTEEVEEEP